MLIHAYAYGVSAYTVFVQGIASSWTIRDLVNYFGWYGQVYGFHLIQEINPDGVKVDAMKGNALVKFYREEEATKLISQTGGQLKLKEKDGQGYEKYMKFKPAKFELLVPNALIRDVQAFGPVGTYAPLFATFGELSQTFIDKHSFTTARLWMAKK